MPNKNKQESAYMSLLSQKTDNVNTYKQALKLEGCECAVCKNISFAKSQQLQPAGRDQNHLISFIKQFPPTFPLGIIPTTSYDGQNGSHLHYHNGNKQQNKNFLFRTKVAKILSNHSLAGNIHIFGQKFSKIKSKYEASAYIRKLQDKKSQNEHKKTESQKKMTSSAVFPSFFQLKQGPKNPQKRYESYSKLSPECNSSKVLYVQSYSHQIPLKVDYDKDTTRSKLDSILRQYLDQELKQFHLQKNYSINQEFWQWVFSQYGEKIFAYFITEFYCRAYTFFSKHTIHKAAFYWIFEKPKSEFGQNTKVTQELGKHKQMLEAQYFISKSKKLTFRVKLSNVKNAIIDYHIKILSFQQQYQQIILQKIKSSPSQQSKAPVVANKNYLYQNRLDTLHSKVRQLFLNEQNKVLKQVEAQKEYEGKEDSNKLARLLLPSMGETQTIRQILNDEFAFQKLILFQQKKIEKQRLIKAKEKLLASKTDSPSTKHIYEQSRVRKKQFVSRRIRMRTQY